MWILTQHFVGGSNAEILDKNNMIYDLHSEFDLSSHLHEKDKRTRGFFP